MSETVLDSLLPTPQILVDRSTHGPRVPLSKRIGVMVHFDDSSSDAGGISWFRSRDFKFSYNRAYLDDGRRCRITPSIHDTAWHAGVCKVEPGLPVGTIGSFKYGGANTGYFGLAFTADGNDHVTDEQLAAMTEDIAVIFRLAAWDPDSVEQRIVGHDSRAVFNPKDNPGSPKLWGKLGRKLDPTGLDSRDPVVDLAQLQEGVRTYLNDLNAPLWKGWPS